MRWLREHPEDAEQRQWDIMNARQSKNDVERVATLPEEFPRLGSEMLQGYTEINWIDWWQQKMRKTYQLRYLHLLVKRLEN